MRYRKKPVEIEAMLWPGKLDTDFNNWLTEKESSSTYIKFLTEDALGSLVIPTLEGSMEAEPGDYVIRGIKGELYPCKPQIFKMSYEKVKDE